MKRNAILSAIFLVATVLGLHAQDAQQILQRAASNFTSAPSVSAAYTLTADGNGGGKYSGRVCFSGKRFTMTSPDILTWFDGKTQWSYSRKNNELTITEPTPDEISQINPFAVINSYRTEFNARKITAPKGFIKIELTPKKPKSDISKVLLTLSEQTLMPTQINLTTRSNQHIAIVLNSVAKGQKFNDKAFQFHAPNYPGVTIIDLR